MCMSWFAPMCSSACRTVIGEGEVHQPAQGRSRSGCTVQLWKLRGAELNVLEAGVLTLNRDYVYDGVQLDVDALFKPHPVFDEATALLKGIGWEAREMRAMLADSAMPAITPGDHCFTPYNCPYYAHCPRDLAQPEPRHHGTAPAKRCPPR